jgi:SOS-response transcriptional repressor LexA
MRDYKSIQESTINYCNEADNKQLYSRQMDTIAHRIARARELKGLNQSELARALSVTPQAVQNWESGKSSPRGHRVKETAAILGITVEYLLFGDNPTSVITVTTPASNVEPMLQPNRKTKDYPLISWIAAGAWAESPDNFHPGSADEWFSSTENAGDHGFWLTVRGDSMTCNGNPTFPEGSHILVRPEAELVSGKYYVVKLLDSGEQTFKQYVEDSGHKYLRPLNPNYRTIEIDGNCHFIGRVIDTKMTGL